MATLDLQRSTRRQTVASRLFAYALLILFGVPFLVPLLWMVSTALKSSGEVFVSPPVWIPRPPQFENFIRGWLYQPGDYGIRSAEGVTVRDLLSTSFTRYLVNTLITTFIPMIGDVFVSAVVAYSFARLRWPGRDQVFSVLLVTMIMPGIVTFIPTFIFFSKLSWVNTFLPFIIPAFFGNAFYIFMLRQFMLNFPEGLDEAARIDGAETFQIFTLIILPLLRPALATVAIFSFMAHWNEFFGPIIYLHRKNLKTLMQGLSVFASINPRFSTEGVSGNMHLYMATTLLVSLPCILLFTLFQKYFVRDVITSGFKL
jgi:ABC-type glycerol-3-phosphate transport system permease component